MVVKQFHMDSNALVRQFAPFMKNHNLNDEALHNAYSARDKYGQHLPLPPKKLLLDEADTNRDGILSMDELMKWKGYQGKSYCRNPGDATYGCLDRCRGGLDGINGEAGYFESYKIERDDYPEDLDEEHIHVDEHYTGIYSKAQRIVMKHQIKSLIHSNVEGDFVHMGMKDEHIWRMTYDTLASTTDTTRKVHLVDPFTGFAQCDHTRDTGMCPLVGTSAPDINELQQDITSWGDSKRIIIHRSHFDKVPQLPKVAMAIVDGALYPTVTQMLKALHPHMAAGGVMMIHDFGWEGYTGVERAVVDFTNSTGRNMKLKLPGSPFGVACYLAMLEKP